MKRVLFNLGLAITLLLSSAMGQNSFFSFSTSSNGSSAANKLSGTAVKYHQLTFFKSGTVSTCGVKVEQSPDGVGTWTDLIAAQTCTSNGSSVIVQGTVNYVRITFSTSVTGGGSVQAVYTGWNAAPSTNGFIFQGVLASIPATCSVGNLAFITDATAGGNIYLCTSINTWTQVTGGGGASYPLTVTGTNSTGTTSVITSTDTASNTGTAWLFNATSSASSAINGILVNRGASGTGSRAFSAKDNGSEKFSVDFSGNVVAAGSIAFGSLLTSTILDANGNPFIKSSATASAVDSLTITNAATASPASVNIAATGSDSNINLTLSAKGSGVISTANQMNVADIQILGDIIQDATSGMTVRAIGGNNLSLSGTHVLITSASNIGAVSSCGTGSPTAAGSDHSFIVTVGTGTPSSCTIAFGASWPAAPACTANSEADFLAVKVVPSTTQVVISTTTPMTASSKVAVHCF